MVSQKKWFARSKVENDMEEVIICSEYRFVFADDDGAFVVVEVLDDGDTDRSTGEVVYIEFVVDGVVWGLVYDDLFEIDFGFGAEVCFVNEVGADVACAVDAVQSVGSNGWWDAC